MAARRRQVVPGRGLMAACLLLATLLCAWPASRGMPANPLPVNVTLHDGSSVSVRLVGDHLSHVAVLEANGQVVVPADPPEGKTGVDFRYASVDDTTGEVVASGPRVSEVDPRSFPTVELQHVKVPPASMSPLAQIRRRPFKGQHVPEEREHDGEEQPRHSADGSSGVTAPRRLLKEAPTTGDVLNLMCVFKFADHTSRTLPTREQITNLMNQRGGGTDAPTGSVRDIYDQGSYFKLNLTSIVTPWCVRLLFDRFDRVFSTLPARPGTPHLLDTMFLSPTGTYRAHPRPVPSR
jgi:hypothetical protein